MFQYRVLFTMNNRRYAVPCNRSFSFANAVARRKVSDGATEVVIEVTLSGKEADDDDPSWPPIEGTVISSAA